MGLEYKNDIDPTSGEDGIMCPLIERKILSNICMENTMAVAGFMDENMVVNKFKEKENWKEICQNCKNFNF